MTIAAGGDFVSGSAAVGAGLLILKPETVRGSQANSALTLGVIGVGNRGTHVTGLFAKNEFLRVAAVADIYDDQLQKAKEKFSGAKTFRSAKNSSQATLTPCTLPHRHIMHPEHFEMRRYRPQAHIHGEAGRRGRGGLPASAGGCEEGGQNEENFGRFSAAIRSGLPPGVRSREIG